MISNANLRVFRRNVRNIIVVWNRSQVDEQYKTHAKAFLLGGDGVEIPLATSKFVPDNPEKFSGDVDGFVIAHCVNRLDPQKEYTVRVIFGSGSDTMAVDKDVLAIGADVKVDNPAPNDVHMFGYDYDLKQWVPLPVEKVMYDRARRNALDKEMNDAKNWWT